MNSLKPLAMNCGPLSEMIRGRAVLEELILPAVEDRGLDSVLVTQLAFRILGNMKACCR
jgi:hypothetical protein